MSKKGEYAEKRILEETLNSFSGSRKAPVSVYVTLVVLYIIASVIVSTSARMGGIIKLFGVDIPIYSFTGVFSSLSNICLIFLAVYCGKRGFITSIIILILQVPMISMGIFVRHNYTSLPGLFGLLLAFITVIIIYVNNIKIDKYQRHIQKQTTTDLLTGIPNRIGCYEVLSGYIRLGNRFAVVSINMNGFKSINNTMGFTIGNEVLIEIANRWKKVVDESLTKTTDFVGRINGDEFAIIINGFESYDEVIESIKVYEKVLHEKITIEGYDFYMTASFGCAIYPDDADDIDTLFSCADVAMQEVKKINSSNHILRFTPEILKVERTLEMANMIRNALEKDLIYFEMQPQYNMNHELRGFETLARMKDDNGNVISPGEFIPVAEKVGLIDSVDSRVFEKSCAFFSDLIKKTGTDIIMSINVSVRHLMKNDFLDEIKELLETSGIPANQLEIEITESIMIDSTDKALKCIDDIKKMGLKIAIDDFGTGYSSLSYLNSFPADLLKIDKSFIDNMNSSDSSKQYVAAIISLGHIMGFEVISEGVEEQDQIDTLKEINCDYIQGFVWGRPLPKEEAGKLVK